MTDLTGTFDDDAAPKWADLFGIDPDWQTLGEYGPVSSYEEIGRRAVEDKAFRDGLLAAAMVCRSQGTDPALPPCPSGMAAVYIESLAAGEMP